MADLNPRLVALRNLEQVVQGRSLDAVLAESAADNDQGRAFSAELSYGLCRWYRQLHAIVSARLQKPFKDKDRDLHFLLMLGVYQLMHSRVPEHAALSSSVDLVRELDKGWAAKLVNAVLRRVQRELKDDASDLHKQLQDLSIRYAQPKWFAKAMARAWPQQQEAILAALQTRGPMTLRVNTRRQPMQAYLQQLAEKENQASTLDAAPDAVVLEKPLPVGDIPGFREGLVSVQDAGAQLAARLLDVQPGQKILDACAAPGGKTGHILELADDLSVTAVDVDETRLQRVEENLHRLGYQAEVSVADAAQPPEAWQQNGFDRILLDVPCSATGVMRRHPDIRLLRRSADIEALALRQAEILRAMWSSLRPGGKLLYVTCSLMPQENHQQITRFLAEQPDAQSIAIETDWGYPCEVGRQTLPGEMTMDGFYYALLEKCNG